MILPINYEPSHIQAMLLISLYTCCSQGGNQQWNSPSFSYQNNCRNREVSACRTGSLKCFQIYDGNLKCNSNGSCPFFLLLSHARHNRPFCWQFRVLKAWFVHTKRNLKQAQLEIFILSVMYFSILCSNKLVHISPPPIVL